MGTVARRLWGPIKEAQCPYGALDLAGSVREWVADWYDKAYYASLPTKISGTIFRRNSFGVGASWASSASDVRSARRGTEQRGGLTHLGFRCGQSYLSAEDICTFTATSGVPVELAARESI